MSPNAVAAVSPKRRTASCRWTWTGSTRPRSCIRSRLRKRERSHSPSSSTTLEVASVSLSPAWSSRRAATLTASPKTSPDISTISPCAMPTCSFSGTGGRGGKVVGGSSPCSTASKADSARRVVGHADARHRVVHVVGGGDARRRRLEHRHQAVAEGLDDLAVVGGDDAGEQRDAARDDSGRVGVAERLVHRCAAAQIGEQHGALQNLGHAEAVGRSIGRKFIASQQAKGVPASRREPLVAAANVRAYRGRSAACRSGSGA